VRSPRSTRRLFRFSVWSVPDDGGRPSSGVRVGVEMPLRFSLALFARARAGKRPDSKLSSDRRAAGFWSTGAAAPDVPLPLLWRKRATNWLMFEVSDTHRKYIRGMQNSADPGGCCGFHEAFSRRGGLTGRSVSS